MPRAKRNTYPNKAAFKQVCQDLAAGAADGRTLTFHDIGLVFGPDFWEILVYALLDSQDAARAIQGAIGRLRAEGKGKVKTERLEAEAGRETSGEAN